jgi:hypothetical protein
VAERFPRTWDKCSTVERSAHRAIAFGFLLFLKFFFSVLAFFLVLSFPVARRQTLCSKCRRELTTDFEGTKNRHPRISRRADTVASLLVEVDAATSAKPAAVFVAERPGWESQHDLFFY